MDDFSSRNLFDLREFEYGNLFTATEPVWQALGSSLDDFFAAWDRWGSFSPLPQGVHLLEGNIFIGPSCRIEPGVVLRGPVIVGAGTEIRTGAYLRGGVVLGRRCVIGAHSELKRAILLDGAHAPHQNYVGDSILGCNVNLGAGTILSNVKNVGSEVTFRHLETTVHTGLRKLGAVLGDGCRTGCNTVLNPGVIMGPGCVTYPNISIRSGYYPPNTLVKLRQVQQHAVLDGVGVD
jgi:bifunctional UDP-N-acetylglucosamine pyrophosphorylase / glucosamine-1-phosphate N-acetyltransferase